MTKQEQVEFVKSLTNSILSNIVEEIESNRIPDKWGSLELKWLLFKRFNNPFVEILKERII